MGKQDKLAKLPMKQPDDEESAASSEGGRASVNELLSFGINVVGIPVLPYNMTSTNATVVDDGKAKVAATPKKQTKVERVETFGSSLQIGGALPIFGMNWQKQTSEDTAGDVRVEDPFDFSEVCATMESFMRWIGKKVIDKYLDVIIKGKG